MRALADGSRVWRAMNGKQKAVAIVLVVVAVGGLMNLLGLAKGTTNSADSGSSNAAAASPLGQWVASYDSPLQEIGQQTAALQAAAADPAAVVAVCRRVSTLVDLARRNPSPPNGAAAKDLTAALSELGAGAAACVQATDDSTLTDAVHEMTAGYRDLTAASNAIADAGCMINDSHRTPSCP